MKTVLKFEEAAMAVIALYALSFHSLGLAGWIWVLLFFTPDISMLGYLAGAKSGAFIYNLFHHKGVAIAIIAIEYFLRSELVLSVGILLFAHASFDRIWGYGLKYVTGFKDTHLGSLEKKPVRPISM
jgi:Domain of unknown function (DUF4260)